MLNNIRNWIIIAKIRSDFQRQYEKLLNRKNRFEWFIEVNKKENQNVKKHCKRILNIIWYKKRWMERNIDIIRNNKINWRILKKFEHNQ